MGDHCLSERLGVRHTGGIDGGPVQLDEPLTLCFGDLQTSMDVDQVSKPKLFGEAIGTTEGLRGEPREVVDMLWLAGTEQRLQKRIGEDAR